MLSKNDGFFLKNWGLEICSTGRYTGPVGFLNGEQDQIVYIGTPKLNKTFFLF